MTPESCRQRATDRREPAARTDRRQPAGTASRKAARETKANTMTTQRHIITVAWASILALLVCDTSAHPGHEHDDAKPKGTRTWTDAKGIFELEASFVSTKDEMVQLRKTDGKLITLPISQLSDDDQQWIKDRQAEIHK